MQRERSTRRPTRSSDLALSNRSAVTDFSRTLS